MDHTERESGRSFKENDELGRGEVQKGLRMFI